MTGPPRPRSRRRSAGTDQPGTGRAARRWRPRGCARATAVRPLPPRCCGRGRPARRSRAEVVSPDVASPEVVSPDVASPAIASARSSARAAAPDSRTWRPVAAATYLTRSACTESPLHCLPSPMTVPSTSNMVAGHHGDQGRSVGPAQASSKIRPELAGPSSWQSRHRTDHRRALQPDLLGAVPVQELGLVREFDERSPGRIADHRDTIPAAGLATTSAAKHSAAPTAVSEDRSVEVVGSAVCDSTHGALVDIGPGFLQSQHVNGSVDLSRSEATGVVGVDLPVLRHLPEPKDLT